MFCTRKISLKPGAEVNNSCGGCPHRTRDGVVILIWSDFIFCYTQSHLIGLCCPRVKLFISKLVSWDLQFRACRSRQTYAHVCNNFLNKVGEGMVLIQCDGPEKGSWLDQWCPASNSTTTKVFNFRSWCFLHSLEEEGRLLNFKAGLKLQKTTFWG